MNIRLFFILLSFLGLTQSSYSLFLKKSTKVKLGIDVLAETNYFQIKDKKIALLTNQSAHTRNNEITLEKILKSNEFELTAIFTPEHGYYTNVPAGKKVDNTEIQGIPVFSLYGSNRRPTKAQMDFCDVVVVDIQDVGVRSYTYISTLYKVMDAAAEYGKKVIVLDRPNPIGGMIVDGNIVEKGKETFVGIAPICYIHGCTIGELANMFNGEGWLPKDEKGKARKCNLSVIKMKRWQRFMTWEDTGLKWFPTSPNIPTVDAVRGMAVLGVFGELGSLIIGIGTDKPFQLLGKLDLKRDKINNELKKYDLPGMELKSLNFKTKNLKDPKKEYIGYQLVFNNENDFSPYTNGFKIMLAIRKFHPEVFDDKTTKDNAKIMFKKVTGTDELYNLLQNNGSDDKILKLLNKGFDDYLKIRKKYLLYK
jgi:uncharacterized protein YbbC (DUF1343 family)